MDQICLWFVCKSCRSSFPGVTNFIKHKTENHFIEFKSVTCIVFEERSYQLDFNFAEADEEIITRPAAFVESHLDENQCSERSQSPKTLNNNTSTLTNSDYELSEKNKHFTNHELDNIDSRTVSFTIENDSVTINVEPLNDVDSVLNPNQVTLTQVNAPENEICDQALMQSAKVIVQEILDCSDSEEKTSFSSDILNNSDSELTAFSPQSVDLSLDPSQKIEINSVFSSFDVCTNAATDVEYVNPGPGNDPLQSNSDQAGKTVEIETSLATVELSERLNCVREKNKDVFYSKSYDISVEAVDEKYCFRENPFVLLRRLSNKELEDVLNISKIPIKQHSKCIDDTGSGIGCVSVNSDTATETSSDSEPDDTSHPKRRKLNSKKKLVGSEPPKTYCLSTSPSTTAKRNLPLSFHCDLCNKSFKFHCNLTLHNFIKHLPMEEKMAQARYKCDQCPTLFYSKGALTYHAESHKSKTKRNRPFVCEICGHSCTTKSELERHLKSHSDSRPFKCQLPNCDKAYKQRKNLLIHVNVSHSNLRPFKCSHPNCTKTFKESKGLKAHILGVHDGKRCYPVQLLPCTQENCDKKYQTLQGLKNHLILVHSVGSDLQTFLCELCGKAFKMKQNLKSHTLLVHTQEYPFKCTIEGCSAAFKLKSRLAEHERAHGGGQNYLCTVCGKSYSIYISFHKHQLSHKKDSSSLEASV